MKDLQASIAFYHERLGFQLDFQGPDGDGYYAGVSRDARQVDPRPSQRVVPAFFNNYRADSNFVSRGEPRGG